MANKKFSRRPKIPRAVAPVLIGLALLIDPIFGQIKKARVLVDSYADKGYLDNK